MSRESAEKFPELQYEMIQATVETEDPFTVISVFSEALEKAYELTSAVGVSELTKKIMRAYAVSKELEEKREEDWEVFLIRSFEEGKARREEDSR